MYLADACALLAYFSRMGVLSAAGRAAMRGEVFVSPVTVWELTHKAGAGKLPPLPTENGSFVGWLEAEKFRFQPLTWADAERANRLPPIHKDPMDRMLIAEALNAGLTVITNALPPIGRRIYNVSTDHLRHLTMSHIQRWGNSLALRLPKPIAEQLKLSEGANVTLSVERGALVVRKAPKKTTLADLLAQCRDDNRHEPIDWGPPVGREIV